MATTSVMNALDEIGKKVGTAAAVLAAYLFFQVQELNEKVDKLDKTTESITEIKADMSKIRGQLDLIIKLNMKEIENVNFKK